MVFFLSSWVGWQGSDTVCYGGKIEEANAG
jgi:hypothetical protein